MDRFLSFVLSGKTDAVLESIPLYSAHVLMSCFLNKIQLLSVNLTRAFEFYFPYDNNRLNSEVRNHDAVKLTNSASTHANGSLCSYFDECPRSHFSG